MYKNSMYLGGESRSSLKLIPALSFYIRKDSLTLLIFFITFLCSVVIAFFDSAITDTVSSSFISAYEVGQISDRTIIASKTLPADSENPVVVTKGERVLKRGFPVSAEAIEKLHKMASSPSYIDFRAFANNVLFLFLLFALWYFLCSPVIRRKKPQKREIITLSVFFVMAYSASVFGSKLAVFADPYMLPVIVPAAFCVILSAVLFGIVPSVFFSFILFLGVCSAVDFQIVPSLFVLASSLTAARIVCRIEKRIDMVIAALLLSLADAVYMTALMVIFNNDFSNCVIVLPLIAVSGFISGILALGFLTPLELLLNTASVFRLMELSDLNNPVMRRMLIAAPGTYNHSLMVATLAESACAEIGANPLLARVGAYYHDLGKVEQSEYFVENQHGSNKHDEINPRLSASVIRSHVKKGVEKAYQMRMPQEVIDIIAEHHGNSLISYFYNEAKKLDDTVSPEEFSYGGNPPSGRESAVVMLADTVEAACRTLENPSVSRLEKFIHQLTAAKIEHRQLDNSNLTFKDISVIEESFVNILAGYYHSRIEYPNQKDPDKDSDADAEKKLEMDEKKETSGSKE